MRAWKKRALKGVAIGFGLLSLVALVGLADAWSAMGHVPESTRLERIAKSPQYRGDHFVDTIPRVEPDMWAAGRRWMQGVPNSHPSGALPILLRKAGDFDVAPASGLRITWFGHSSLLVEIDGMRILVDPVWGERCSPSSFTGPKRFHPPPLPLEALPKLDAILISHDHYDHLDYPTVVALKARKVPFIVPLGVGSHLEYWGVESSLIRELDWWDRTQLGKFEFVATPARHFSGRGFVRDKTLWSGWAILGPEHRVYYSGDTAMFEGFEQIGARLGPFDATLIESGAYDQMWADVHLGPEQAVAAHQKVRGKVMLPVHWGTFDLALHSWVEPAERVLAAAREHGVTVVVPRPGESIEPSAPPKEGRWWPEVPWRTATEYPVVSSGLGALP